MGYGNWILIDEKLPDTEDYILLSFENFSLPQVGRYEYDHLEESGAFYLGDELETCISQDLYVNAWMPLPKCYREENAVGRMSKSEPLTHEQKEWAYEKWCNGYTFYQIAKALNVCTKTVQRVIHGRDRIRPILRYER